jgi:hypothetical protein
MSAGGDRWLAQNHLRDVDVLPMRPHHLQAGAVISLLSVISLAPAVC